MKKCNANIELIESSNTVSTIRNRMSEDRYAAYIGLDVHKDTIAVAVARRGRQEPASRGEIGNSGKAIRKLAARLAQEYSGEVLLFCYEAGPCGYVIYRQLLELGIDCQVVACAVADAESAWRAHQDGSPGRLETRETSA